MNRVASSPKAFPSSRAGKVWFSICILFVLVCVASAWSFYGQMAEEDAVLCWFGIGCSILAGALWIMTCVVKPKHFIVVLILANLACLYMHNDSRLRHRQWKSIYAQQSSISENAEIDWMKVADRLSKTMRVGHFTDMLLLSVGILNCVALMILGERLLEDEKSNDSASRGVVDLDE